MKRIKWTPQRLAILKFLDGNKDHPSVEDIYEALSKDFPTMSVATVYNVLEFLKNTGRIKEIYVDPQKRRFDPDTTTHHHAICINCKRVYDIYQDIEIPTLNQYLPDFKIIDTHIQIHVLCPACKSKTDIKLDEKEYQCTICGSIRTAKHKPHKCFSCGSKGSMQEINLTNNN